MKQQKREFVKLKKRSVKTLIFVISLCLTILSCSGKNKTQTEYKNILFLPPNELLVDIELPDRSKIKTVGDMVRIITADEEVILLKNADLKALREYVKNIKMVDNKNAE